MVFHSSHILVFSIDRIYGYSDIRCLVPSKEALLEALKKDDRFEVSSDNNIQLADRKMERDTSNKRTVRLAGISLDTTEEQLAEAFKEYPEIQSFEMKKNLNTGLFIGVVYVVLDQCNSVSSFLDKQIVIGKQEVREVSPLLNYYDYRRSVVKRSDHVPGCLYVVRGIPKGTSLVSVRVSSSYCLYA
ncbi:hypothetical protein BLSTO_03560 [Blastocystis sp. subtype 1]